MKIIHLAGGGDTGGAKTHIITLLKELSKENDVMLISLRSGSFARSAIEEGIPTIVIKNPFVIKTVLKLVKTMKEFTPEVLHCHGSRANMMGAIIKLFYNVPVVTTVHSDYRLDYMHSRLKQMTFGTINAIALRFIDYYTAVASRTADMLISRGFDPERIFTIYNCIDFSKPKTVVDKKSYLQKLGLHYEDDDVIVSVAARLNPVKDLGTLIRAVKIASGKNPHIKLMIAGEGDDKKKLKELTKRLKIEDRVCFAGWVPEIDQFFAASDITVISSLSETFPYSITEGVREGCAAISSDVGGMSDLIEHGRGGFIFQPGDVDALADYLYQMCSDNDLRKKLADHLYEKASNEFSIDRMKNTQISIYKNLIRNYKKTKNKKRYGVMICGAYGRGNAGDDAILKAVVNTMRVLDPDMPIYVMSRNPLETKLVNRVNSFYIFHVFTFLRKLYKCSLFINGGGSLIQDVTSNRSLYYYLFTLYMAKLLSCHVLMYGCGIGPVFKEANRKIASYVLNRSVDIITLREDTSLEELKSLGVNRPKISLAADSAINLAQADADETDAYFDQEGIPKDGHYICFALREWKNLDRSSEIAKAADYAYEKYGLVPVFLAAEFPKDIAPAERVAEKMKAPHYVLRKPRTVEVTIAILRRMDLVCAMRLHALVFSASAEIPVIAMSYDVKVSGFMKYIGSDLCLSFETLEADKLCNLIDRALSGDFGGKVKNSSKMLREREKINEQAAKELLRLP
ncbi:MAG: polysaccharide pyruvyl transferase CsaB [Clostridiales bacterium]|nr:polysaccharide pyruvyl transferase CsaB [Clostridiales bacterium]